MGLGMRLETEYLVVYTLSECICMEKAGKQLHISVRQHQQLPGGIHIHVWHARLWLLSSSFGSRVALMKMLLQEDIATSIRSEIYPPASRHFSISQFLFLLDRWSARWFTCGRCSCDFYIWAFCWWIPYAPTASETVLTKPCLL